jgi:hypothetical protein
VTAAPQVRRVDRQTLLSGSAPSSGEVRLPTRPRRLGQWAATVLFVVASVVAAGWLWQQHGDRVEVLSVGVAVPAGHVVERGDLTTVSVSGVDGAISTSELDRVVGSTAATALLPGQVLTESLLTSDSVPAADQRVVGVELDATRAPTGLVPGDVVTVLAVPPSGDPSDEETLGSPMVLANSAMVFGADRVEGAGTRISLVVAEDVANQVAAFGAAGRVALVQAPIGTGR